MRDDNLGGWSLLFQFPSTLPYVLGEHEIKKSLLLVVVTLEDSFFVPTLYSFPLVIDQDRKSVSY